MMKTFTSGLNRLCPVIFMLAFSAAFTENLTAQPLWTVAPGQEYESRVDDIFMLNERTGYAVCGDGRIAKTTTGGKNWSVLTRDTTIYYRSVEFVDELKGFVGGFSMTNRTRNVFRKTTDGGATWTDLTSLIHPKAREGICGLAAPDGNTIYGCGNWFRDSAYLVKSTDGGNTWSFIDMHAYATSLIDMHFLNKDTGFATGRGPAPLRTGIILHTTDGGQTWTSRFTDTVATEYCWKIFRLNERIYFATLEDFSMAFPRILKSLDGGQSWSVHALSAVDHGYNLEGIGFIDSLNGWAGGGSYSFKTHDGGNTWSHDTVCPKMNRAFRVNDSLLFASGDQIWRFGTEFPATGLRKAPASYATMECYPNPVQGQLNIHATLKTNTHLLLVLCNSEGRMIREIENSNRQRGTLSYRIDTEGLTPGNYFLVLKTHEADQVLQVMVK